MDEICALLGNVTGINRELYNIVYEGTVSLVEEVDAIPEFEVLFAGIPVQSFLVAGKGAVKDSCRPCQEYFFEKNRTLVNRISGMDKTIDADLMRE